MKKVELEKVSCLQLAVVYRYNLKIDTFCQPSNQDASEIAWLILAK